MAELDDSEYPPIGVQAPDVPPGLPMPSQSPVVSAPAPVAPPIAPGTPLGSGGQPLPPFQRSYTLSHTPQPQPDQSGGLGDVPLEQAKTAIAAAMQYQAYRAYIQYTQKGGDAATGLAMYGSAALKGVPPAFQKPNFTPTTTTVGGRNLLQMSPNRYTDVTPASPHVAPFKPNPVDAKKMEIITKRIEQMSKDLTASQDEGEKSQIAYAIRGAQNELEGMRSQFVAPTEGSAPQRAPVTAPVGAAKAPSGDMVSVINPTGKRIKIRKSQLQDALKQGYTQP